ncbi:MAG: hypothetical protein ACJAT7_001221 [Psychromonas sp.]|jgi:hypothetical protein|uniref:DUF2919 domain-containing protein n=1 Tax=Psychromonas sp. TaxID=1884585 RepID=UPI0039E29A6D
MHIPIFPLHCYTESGNLKPPLFFYLSLLFLARAWALFIISQISPDTGGEMLTLFYPVQSHLYFGLISSFIALLLFFLSGRDHDKQRILSKLWQRGFLFLLSSIIGDFALQLYYLSINHFHYSLQASLQLVIIIWIFLYSVRSRQLKASFIRHK